MLSLTEIFNKVSSQRHSTKFNEKFAVWEIALGCALC